MNLQTIPGATQALERIASEHGVTALEVLGRGRTKSVARARAHFAHVLRASTELSYPEIGRLLGRDHTTAMHGDRAHEIRLTAQAVRA
jgi:chromosomal replication initiation ATPase DnaA